MYHIKIFAMPEIPPPDPVSYRLSGQIAIITIANPPVNALGHAVRRGLLDASARFASDAQAQAAVLTSEGRAFIAGADVAEFIEGPAAPLLPRVVAALDALEKPIVAALDGVTLGGGLEVALACSHRVAGRKARLGFPEVKLGLLPGAGGTQRLPRLVGIETALEMITSGLPVTAARAFDLGIVDELVELASVEQAAVDVAARLAMTSAPAKRVSSLSVHGLDADQILDAAIDRAKSSPILALKKCVEAVGASRLPYSTGVKIERRLFLSCRRSRQHAALLHGFLAQRKAGASRVPGRPITAAAVVGGGTMGAGIAVCFADAGYRTLMLEANATALAAGLGRVKAIYASRIKGGRLDEAQAKRRLRLISGGSYRDLAEVDLVVEAVPEVMDLKRKVFAELDKHARPDAILATNTSALDIEKIAQATKRPKRVLGMHFFAPAQRMRLLEVVRGSGTSEAVHATVMAVGKALGKAPVSVGACPGFVGNRLYGHYGREAEFLLEEGATPTQVDAALTRFGMAMGPFAVRDLSGNDVGRNIRLQAWANLPSQYPRPGVLERLFQAGRLGQKSGAGYYRYEAGSPKALPDPRVLRHIKAAAAVRGIKRGRVSARLIIDRCIYALINEGAKTLAEGMAQRSSDIDMIYVTGYGFPAWRGGPMYLADRLGAAKVHSRVKEFHGKFGPWWEPAPLLADLARSGGCFADA